MHLTWKMGMILPWNSLFYTTIKLVVYTSGIDLTTRNKMSLTRNLYRFDEVRASFLLCLKYRRKNAALFWLEEMEESFYSGEARRLLLVGWSLFVGCAHMSWLVDWASKSDTRGGRLELTCQLLNCMESDGSIPLILWSGIILKDYCNSSVVNQWKSICALEDTDFWKHVVSSHNDVRIDDAIDALQIDMRSYAIFAKAAGFLVALSSKMVPKESWEPVASITIFPGIRELLDSWKSSNVLERRAFAILSDAHFGMTKRGKGADTTEELRNLSLDDLAKSVFWKRIIPADRDDDEDVEAFWDAHFGLCDIPDEWSKTNQEKSHGRGSTRKPESPLIHWWNLWIPKDHLFVWGDPQREVLTWMKNEPLGSSASILDKLIEMYKVYVPPSQPFIRVKKEFVFD